MSNPDAIAAGLMYHEGFEASSLSLDCFVTGNWNMVPVCYSNSYTANKTPQEKNVERLSPLFIFDSRHLYGRASLILSYLVHTTTARVDIGKRCVPRRYCSCAPSADIAIASKSSVMELLQHGDIFVIRRTGCEAAGEARNCGKATAAME